MPRDGHVSLWHPWKDRPGSRHTPVLFSDLGLTDIDDIVETIGGKQYYGLVEDILSGLEIDSRLLRDKRTETYLSRTGGAVALRIRRKRSSGFIIPSKTWLDAYPTQETTERMKYIFDRFGYEAITPASLSEKVLRSTLPERLIISRPDSMTRQSLIDNDRGGRISKGKTSKHKKVFEYDKIKAYLHYSRNVVSPFVSSVRFWHDQFSWQSAPASWLQVKMTCKHDGGMQPIEIKGENGDFREPIDGETFDTWLWSEELQLCLKAGYTLHYVEQGFLWNEMSSFMSVWSDILWDKYSQETDEKIKDIEKGMMVGLPGRFLKAPEKYTLVHYTEARKGDKPLLKSWEGGKSPLSEWCMRIEQDVDSAQLTPVGSFIIMKCRKDIYEDVKREEERGNRCVRVYIDSMTFTEEATTIKLGTKRGEHKRKYYTNVTIQNNRFVGRDENGKLVLKAPSVSGEENRERAIKELENSICENRNKPPP